MALKLKIGGTSYGFAPDSLKVKSVMGATCSADFKLHGLLANKVNFQRGQEVIIYDDAVQESVTRSTVFGPYGAPGILSLLGHNGRAYGNIPFPANNFDDGTVEFMAMANQGIEVAEGLLKEFDYSVTLFDFTNGPNLNVELFYDQAAQGLAFRAWFFVEGGQVKIESEVGNPAIKDTTPFRLTVSWHYLGGYTTYFFYVNGELIGTDTKYGKIIYSGETSTTAQWYSELQEMQPMAEMYLADVRVWQINRAQEDIQADMYAVLAGTETGLIAYWKIDEGTGITLANSVAGGQTGHLIVGSGGYALEWGVAATDWTGAYDGSGTTETVSLDYRYFCGRIVKVTTRKLPPIGYEQNIHCEDWTGRLNDMLLSVELVNKTCGDIIRLYVPRLFELDEIGCRTVADGPMVPTARYFFTEFKRVLDEIQKGSNYVWYIDPYKELRFHAKGAVSAPFDLDNINEPLLYLRLTCDDSQGKYYNTLYTRGKFIDFNELEQNFLLVTVNRQEIAARAAVEGGSGVYEHYEDLATTRNPSHGIWVSQGMLADAIEQGLDVHYTTRGADLRPGMTQHVTNSDYDVDSDFIIIESTFGLEAGKDPQYDVLLTSARRSKQLESLLDGALESKTNFRNELVTSYFQTGHTEQRDSVSIYDSLDITTGDI